MSTQSEADDSETDSETDCDVCVQCGQVFETYDHPRDGFVCSDCRGVKVGDELWFCENCTHVFSGVAVVDTQAISQGRTRLNMEVCMSKLISFRLTWSPEGKYIGTVRAKDALSARRKAPLPYRKYPGEIAVEEGSGPPVVVEDVPVKTVYTCLYRIDWYRNGNCFVSSTANGSLTGAYINGSWDHDHALPDDVRALAMESKP